MNHVEIDEMRKESKIVFDGKNSQGQSSWKLLVPDEHIVKGLEVMIRADDAGLTIGGCTLSWGDILLAMHASVPDLPDATHAEVFRVGEFRSSSEPEKAVLCLATGAKEITRHEEHHSFIRWVTPYMTTAMSPDRKG